ETLIGEKRARFVIAAPELTHVWEEPPADEPVLRAPSAFDASLFQEPLSTRAVEDLIACPLRFALRKWRIEDSALFTLNDAKDEGEWLHAVLEAFFTGSYKGEVVAEPLEVPREEDSFIAYCNERLQEITLALLPESARGSS